MGKDFVEVPRENYWILSIIVDELDITYGVKVTDSMTVSMILLNIINRIDLKFNWLEFGLWCDNQKRQWLLPNSANLIQFDLNSDCDVHFVRRHRTIDIQLPDLQITPIMIDLSMTVFQICKFVCTQIGIRHHEELSFQYRSVESPLRRTTSYRRIKKKNNQLNPYRSLRRSTNNASINLGKPDNSSVGLGFENSLTNRLNGSLQRSTTSSISTYHKTIDPYLREPFHLEGYSHSQLPEKSYKAALRNGDIISFRDYKERSKLRFPWLVSEFTLMNQGIYNLSNILLLLRFKYHSYLYLDDRYDGVRINQMFKQAYWSIMSHETTCSDDEALILGGIRLQVKKSTEKESIMTKSYCGKVETVDLDQEINTALEKLEYELLGRYETDIDEVDLSISGVVYVLRYPRNIFTTYTKHYAKLKENGIQIFTDGRKQVTEIIPIKGNSIEMRVRLPKKEYFILEISILNTDIKMPKKNERTFNKYELKFFDKTQFIRWVTGCRLLAKSIDFSTTENFKYEYNVVTNILAMRQPNFTKQLPIDYNSAENDEINLSDLIPTNSNRPFKRQYNLNTIVQCQRSFVDYNSVQSKIAYIKCWLTLRDAGICYFQVFVNDNLEKELIGIGYNGLLLANIDTGDARKIWHLSDVITWNTNWELKYTILEFEDRKMFLQFSTVSDCQSFHEYFGGYLFILMRNSGKFSDMSEKTFRKLTARNYSAI